MKEYRTVPKRVDVLSGKGEDSAMGKRGKRFLSAGKGS
jgi:hypothetical protein